MSFTGSGDSGDVLAALACECRVPIIWWSLGFYSVDLPHRLQGGPEVDVSTGSLVSRTECREDPGERQLNRSVRIVRAEDRKGGGVQVDVCVVY